MQYEWMELSLDRFECDYKKKKKKTTPTVNAIQKMEINEDNLFQK